MPIYAEATPGQATHTLEILRGPQYQAEGEDFATFFSGDTQAADSILAWLENQGVTPEDPDLYALVCPMGEGQDNWYLTALPIAPLPGRDTGR